MIGSHGVKGLFKCFFRAPAINPAPFRAARERMTSPGVETPGYASLAPSGHVFSATHGNKLRDE
jgi:hypothetical protein